MVAIDGIWFGVLIALPLPILAGLLMHRLLTRTEAALIFLSLRSEDTDTAMRLFTLGFLTLLILRLYYLLTPGPPDIIVSSVIGSITSLSIAAGLAILTITVHGPQSRFYHLLPTSLADRIRTRLQDRSTTG